MKQNGDKIRFLRCNKNITQAQLAEALAVSAQSVSKWENHLSLPDISLLPVLARFFGITMDELFGYRLDALNEKERFIRFMADNGVLRFGSFPLKSGRTSPYHIQTGRYRTASQLSRLGGFYARYLHENNVPCTLLMAASPSETPAVLATGAELYRRYGMDLAYSTGSSAGRQPVADDRIVLIEDTLTSGHTLKNSLQGMQNGLLPKDVLVAVDRMERGENSPLTAKNSLQQTFGVRIHAIVTLDDIVAAMQSGIVGSGEQLEGMLRYKETYGGI
jgi:orotate phosphoribosyltransferase